MKTLELKQMEEISGGTCVMSTGMAVVAVAGLALFLIFPPAGLFASMVGGAVAGMSVGGSIAAAGIDCFLEK